MQKIKVWKQGIKPSQPTESVKPTEIQQTEIKPVLHADRLQTAFNTAPPTKRKARTFTDLFKEQNASNN